MPAIFRNKTVEVKHGRPETVEWGVALFRHFFFSVF